MFSESRMGGFLKNRRMPRALQKGKHHRFPTSPFKKFIGAPGTGVVFITQLNKCFIPFDIIEYH